MPTVKENLIAAKALIDTPEKWGKGEFEDPDNGCLCAFGAVMKAKYGRVLIFGGDGEDEDFALMYALSPEVVDGPAYLPDVAAFNDHPDTTHADIMALFDRAIANA